MKILFAISIAAVFAATPAMTQGQHHQQSHQTPYSGLQQRSIKALSEQQIADLRAGRGMGLALAAELNGYPGPLHVMELADQLQLDAQQRHRVRQLFDEMKSEAMTVGEQLIAQEAALDRAFAEQKISGATLDTMTAQIAGTQGRLRQVHLKFHLTVADLLTPHQKDRYAHLRGYR